MYSKTELAIQAHDLLKPHQQEMMLIGVEALERYLGEGVAVAEMAVDDAGRVAAFARVYEHDFRGQGGERVLEICSFVVDPDYRGPGYGTRVFGRALKLAREIDPEALVVAIVRRDNERPMTILGNWGANKLAREEWPGDFGISAEMQSEVVVWEV